MVDTFDPHLSCEKVRRADDIKDYVVKEISLDGEKRNPIQLETPCKTLDSLGVQAIVEKKVKTPDFIKNKTTPLIVECPLYVSHPQTWKGIGRLIESSENDVSSFRKIIRFNSNLNSIKPDVIVPTVVFNKNPFIARKTLAGRTYQPFDEDNFETFLQNLYTHSKNLLLVPDVKFGKNFNTELYEYIRIITNFMDVLAERNKKPIFVPIQPTITKKAITEILEHYRKNKYSNIWIDYTGSALNEKHQSGVRMILRALDKAFGDDYVVYHSQMNKILTTSIDANEAPSSDILSQFLGADFIGCNVKPWRFVGEMKEQNLLDRGFKSVAHYNDVLLQSKARIFNPNTYYYHSPKAHQDYKNWKLNDHKIMNDVGIINALNTIYKFNEVEKVKEEYSGKKKISPYLKKKKLFIENNEIYDNIVGKVIDTSWMDF